MKQYKESHRMEEGDNLLHEVNRYDDGAFPVGMYTVTVDGIEPEGRGYLDLHWHEELQLTMALTGTVTMRVNGEDYPLNAGEAIFINKNLLHVTSELSEDGRYFSINFPDKLLGFFIGSRMELDHVRPYTDNYLFPVMVFRDDVDWNRDILSSMLDIREQLLSRQNAYQYRVSQQLTNIWYELITHIGRLSRPSAAYIRKQERMQKMIAFIHSNYSDSILLGDIAKAAGVSEGECCRCFRDTIHESPNQYLIKYRISRACEMLTDTSVPVTEIAFDCGFNDTSHFIDYFRKRTGMTPLEYRSRKS